VQEHLAVIGLTIILVFILDRVLVIIYINRIFMSNLYVALNSNEKIADL